MAAILVVVLLSSGGRPVAEQRAERFVAAWARADYAAMHAELTESARRARPVADFAKDYRRAAETATATRFTPGPVGKVEGRHGRTCR